MLHEVVYASPAAAIALVDSRCVVFARVGPLAPDALETLKAQKTRLAATARAKGLLAVMHGNAGVSKHDVVERQRLFLVEAMREHSDLSVEMVVVGDGAQAIAMRTVTRVFSLGKKALTLHHDVGQAARWLGERAELDAAALERVVTAITPRPSASA